MATEKPNPRNPSEFEKGESGLVSSNGSENSQEISNTSSIDKVRESDEYLVRRTGDSEKGEEKIVSDIDIPLIMEGKDAREEYLQCVQNDETLVKIGEYADSEVKGYFWDNGVLKKLVRDGLGHEIHLTKPLRSTLLRLSHDFNGHVGVKKVKAILNRLYTWPGLQEDVLKWCKSCEVCQKHKRAWERKAELILRPVITEPFESVAFDIVVPFPKSKSRYKYLITLYLCNISLS